MSTRPAARDPPPVVNVTKDTVQKELVDSGYYTAADIGS